MFVMFICDACRPARKLEMEVREAMAASDTNGDGELDFVEVLAMCAVCAVRSEHVCSSEIHCACR